MSVRTTPTRSDSVLPSATVYDLLLILLPLPLLCGAVASLLTPLPVPLGVGVGSLPSAALFAYVITAAAPAEATAPSG